LSGNKLSYFEFSSGVTPDRSLAANLKQAKHGKKVLPSFTFSLINNLGNNTCE